MQLLIDGNQAPLGNLTLRESVFEYAATLTFQSFAPLAFENATLVASDVETKYGLVRTEQVSQFAYQYTCYPQTYLDFLNKVTDPLNQEITVDEVLKALALTEFSVIHRSLPLHYSIPSLRGRSILDFLVKFSKFEQGGCPTYHFGTSGGLIVSDLLSECLEEYKGTFVGTTQKSNVSFASQNKNAGKVIFHFYDEDSYSTQEVTFLENSGVTNLYRRVNDEASKALVISEMQSKFWRAYFQTQSLQVTDTAAVGISPGIKVRSMVSEFEYIVTATSTTIDNNQSSTTLDLCRAIQPEQKL